MSIDAFNAECIVKNDIASSPSVNHPSMYSVLCSPPVRRSSLMSPVTWRGVEERICYSDISTGATPASFFDAHVRVTLQSRSRPSGFQCRGWRHRGKFVSCFSYPSTIELHLFLPFVYLSTVSNPFVSSFDVESAAGLIWTIEIYEGRNDTHPFRYSSRPLAGRWGIDTR